MKKTVIISVAAIVLTGVGLLVSLRSKTPRAPEAQPLSKDEIETVVEAQNLFKRAARESAGELANQPPVNPNVKLLEPMEALAREHPDNRSVRLLADMTKCLAKSGTRVDFNVPFREESGREVPLYKAIQSPQTTIEVVVAMLYSPSQTVRSMGIGLIHGRKEQAEAAVPRLIELAESTQEGSEFDSVIWALAAIRDHRAIPVLKNYAKSPSATSCQLLEAVREALKAIGETP